MMKKLEKEYLKLRELGLTNLQAEILDYEYDNKGVISIYEIGVILYDGRIRRDAPEIAKVLEDEYNYFICAARHGDDGNFIEIVSIEEGVLVNHAFDVLIPKDINIFTKEMLPLVSRELNGDIYFVTERE